MEGMRISAQNAAHIQAYIEYENVVGGADGGKMFTPQQFEEYKDHLRKNANNRVYTSWKNGKGLDCKMIGPASTCICGHKYKMHNYVNPVNKKVVCKTPKCSCPCFYYVPVHGSMDFKCLCKSSSTLHDPITKKCPKGKPGSATGRFMSTWSCSCGYKFGEHETIIETREERIALGKPVDDMSRMMGEFGAITGGGITNFSSMVDGAEGYGAQIDALGSLEYQDKKAIGYSQQQKALPHKSGQGYGQSNHDEGPGNQKLSHLNQKLRLEKEMNALSVSDSKYSNSVALSEQPEEGISAYDLYNTPHNFARTKINVRKPLKY